MGIDILEKLNERQKEAVTYINGPLLVLAGAGSGKTRVLTTRIAYMIGEGISPDNILAITFTNKAAGEMKDRIYKLIGYSARSMQISTFHSFGLKIIKENYDILGYDKNFLIFDSDDSLTIVKKICKDKNIDTNKFNPRMIRNKISSLKNDLVTPSMYKQRVCDEFDNIISKVYTKYEDTLIKNNSLDFDDLLILPIKLFKERKDILESYQGQYKYILIDEYQDTNEAQYILTKLLSSKYKNICCVGDADQAIYGFRGARPDILVNLANSKETYTYRIKRNYRNGGEILAFAKEKLLNGGPWDDSIAMSDDMGKVYRMADTPSTIIRLIKDTKDSDYKDWFILGRTNEIVDRIVMELQAAQIPCDTFKMAGKTAQELHDIVESNSVKVLTIHTSKGLEAKNVIVIGTRNKGYDEEENRLNYVAATRAKKRLFWTYPAPKQFTKKKKESNGTKNWER